MRLSDEYIDEILSTPAAKVPPQMRAMARELKAWREVFGAIGNGSAGVLAEHGGASREAIAITIEALDADQ